MTLTKADIAGKIANDCGFWKTEAAEILDKLIEIMKKKLIAGETIMIYRFGSWHVRSKRPRRGRNPNTGEQMILDARRVVTWKRSKVLGEAVNKAGKGLKS